MRHLWTVSYGFVGILYSRRLILLYSNHLEGRQTVENYLVHIGTQCMHVMMSENFHLSSFFCGFYFCGSRSVCKNHENLHPAEISHYTVGGAVTGVIFSKRWSLDFKLCDACSCTLL